MDNLKKELIFSIVISEREKGELSYQVNPELTVGIDPRNEVILISPRISPKHLHFLDLNEELLLTHIGANETTTLNGVPLYQNQKYFLKPSDILKIDQYTIKIKKEFAYRHDKIKTGESAFDPSADTTILKNVTKSKSLKEINYNTGLNFTPIEANSENVRVSHFKDDHTSEFKIKNSIISEKKNKIEFTYEKLSNLFMGVFFDFFLAYFLLSTFTNIKIHLYFFFMLQEIIFILVFKTSFFQRILETKFHKQFTVWILLFVFILFPLTKGSFSTQVYNVPIKVSNLIDIHGKAIESHSLKDSLSIQTNLDSNLFLIPDINQNHPLFNFYNLLTHENFKIIFQESIETDHLLNFFARTHPFRFPVKSTTAQLDVKNYFERALEINKQTFKEIVIRNGPFLSFINDTKTFFLSDFTGKIEKVELGPQSPIFLFRDQQIGKIFFIGKSQIVVFKYDRQVNHALEDLFIEKLLANIHDSLIKKQTNEIGFLEMFDSLPNVDLQVLLTLFQQDLERVRGNNLQELTDLYLQSIDHVILEINKESRNAGPILVNQVDKNLEKTLEKQFNELKNKFQTIK